MDAVTVAGPGYTDLAPGDLDELDQFIGGLDRPISA